MSDPYGTGRIGLTSSNRDDIFGGPIATEANSEYESQIETYLEQQGEPEDYIEQISETALVPEAGYSAEESWNSEFGLDNQVLFEE